MDFAAHLVQNSFDMTCHRDIQIERLIAWLRGWVCCPVRRNCTQVVEPQWFIASRRFQVDRVGDRVFESKSHRRFAMIERAIRGSILGEFFALPPTSPVSSTDGRLTMSVCGLVVRLRSVCCKYESNPDFM